MGGNLDGQHPGDGPLGNTSLSMVGNLDGQYPRDGPLGDGSLPRKSLGCIRVAEKSTSPEHLRGGAISPKAPCRRAWNAAGTDGSGNCTRLTTSIGSGSRASMSTILRGLRTLQGITTRRSTTSPGYSVRLAGKETRTGSPFSVALPPELPPMGRPEVLGKSVDEMGSN